jgi:Uma2 family endonuclease
MNLGGPFTVYDPVVREGPRRAGLVNGRFVIVTLPTRLHNYIAFRVAELFNRILRHRGVAIPSGGAPTSIRTLREPDVAVYLGLTEAKMAEEGWESWLERIPDLVVEVLSASTAAEDRHTKFDEYERIGIREYYLIDPETADVDGFTLKRGRYQRLSPSAHGFRSRVLRTTIDLRGLVRKARGKR